MSKGRRSHNEAHGQHVPKLTKPLPKPPPPSPLKGHLWKENPSGFHLQKFKWRYIAVMDTGVQWWQSEKEEQAGRPAKGRLDFAINPCEVAIEDERSGKIIVLKPLEGSWVEANFTGADRGRELRFSCKGSEHSADKWVKEMRAHMEHGKAWRVRASMVAESFDRKKKEDEKSDAESGNFGNSEESDDSDSSDTSSEESENEEGKEEGKEAVQQEVAIRTVESDARTRNSTASIDPENAQDKCFEAPRILVWNIEACCQDSTNILEFLPTEGVLCPEEEASLEEALRQIMQTMTDSQKSPKLEELLCGDRPLEEAGELEKAPLTVVPPGLIDWLLSRSDKLEEVWPHQTAEQVAVEWCADYSSRWKFWKRQTVNEWLRDDGSGGNASSIVLKVQCPTVADACQTMSLYAADQLHRRRAPRGSDDILRTLAREDVVSPPAAGERDFFRLLVWDLIVKALFSKFATVGKILDVIAAETAPGSGGRFRSIRERVEQTSDIAVLLGVPTGLMDVQSELIDRFREDFWEVRPPENGAVRILARKSLFDKPNEQRNLCNGAMLSCMLHPREGPEDGNKDLHVIACRAAMKADLVAEVEAAMTPCTILGGSLWDGSLRDHCLKLDAMEHPKLSRLLPQVDGISENLGSVCRRFSPVQAQVTKMMETEVVLHEFIFLGDDFQEADVEGLLSADHCESASSMNAALTTVARSATVCL